MDCSALFHWNIVKRVASGVRLNQQQRVCNQFKIVIREAIAGRVMVRRPSFANRRNKELGPLLRFGVAALERVSALRPPVDASYHRNDSQSRTEIQLTD